MTWNEGFSVGPAFWDVALPEAGSFMVNLRLSDGGPTEVDLVARDAIEDEIDRAPLLVSTGHGAGLSGLRVDFLPNVIRLRDRTQGLGFPVHPRCDTLASKASFPTASSVWV